jgi:hypothetical protein
MASCKRAAFGSSSPLVNLTRIVIVLVPEPLRERDA